MEDMCGISRATALELVDFVSGIESRDRKPGSDVRFMLVPETVQFLGRRYAVNTLLEVTDTTTYADGEGQWSHARVVFGLDRQTGKINARVMNFPWSVAVEIMAFLDRKSASGEWPVSDIQYVPKR